MLPGCPINGIAFSFFVSPVVIKAKKANFVPGGHRLEFVNNKGDLEGMKSSS